LQRRYGVPVAAHRWEAELVNRRDREACGAEWLDQPVEPYEVDRALSEGDEIDAGGITLRVLHTTGHTLGHVSLWEPEEGVLILGDAVHGDDVSWINPFREGVGGIVRALETLDRLSELPVRRAYSGHGPVIENLAEAISAAQRRYERWLDEPERACWHACKRILAYALMIYGGMPEGELHAYLLRCPWFDDYARHGFGVDPEEFLQPLLAEMLRSKAAAWRDGRLVALGRHNLPPSGWSSGPVRPKDWPAARRPGEATTRW
jgi:hydroxyacylglutathione hydrolase